ncbi:hypothetical protein RF11_01049 [Thelohanellus kitauei]|uniref:Uncharacterized protein n=1 Tax=Thelohanellus kitauei TaxID=669202 RepID=A0A0C2IJA9_THEKT|nr:hypothetical protein RF11_01049 [Thelohanellus kitauei]
MTAHEELGLYLIYFILVAFPIIDLSLNSCLHRILIELHGWIHKYIEICFSKGKGFEKVLLILQYYFKSITTLNIPVSHEDRQIFHGLWGMLSKNQLLTSNFLVNIRETSKKRKTSINTAFFPVKNIINDLMNGLSDVECIKKLQTEQKLFLYEDVKTDYLRIINDDYIKSCGKYQTSNCPCRFTVNQRESVSLTEEHGFGPYPKQVKENARNSQLSTKRIVASNVMAANQSSVSPLSTPPSNIRLVPRTRRNANTPLPSLNSLASIVLHNENTLSHRG